MGIRITTDDYGVKIWRSDKFGFPQYAIAVGVKLEDGKRVNEYQQVQFRKGVELENGDEIYIDEAFPTLRTWTDKQSGELRHKTVWMITDWSYRARHEQPTSFNTGNGERVYVDREMAEAYGNKANTQIDMSDLPDTFAAAEDDIPF